MKLHSYVTVNGHHQYASIQSAIVLDKLKKAALSVGGWEQAIADANPAKTDFDASNERIFTLSTPEMTSLCTSDVSDDVTATSVDTIHFRKCLEAISEENERVLTFLSTPDMTPLRTPDDITSAITLRKRLAAIYEKDERIFASSSTPEMTPLCTPDVSDDVTATSVDISTAIALRKRLAAVSEKTNGNIATSFKNERISSCEPDTHRGAEPHPLLNHPDEIISSLVKELTEFQNDLTGPGPQCIKWPHNICWRDYALYLLTPTLVYEMEYPRTDRYVLMHQACSLPRIIIHRIRPLYIFEKTVCTIDLFLLLFSYIV